MRMLFLLPPFLASQAGADPEAQDDHGHTPARVAGMHGHRRVVELLLRRAGSGDRAATAARAAAAASAAAGPEGNIDAFMKSSKEALKQREEAAVSCLARLFLRWLQGHAAV